LLACCQQFGTLRGLANSLKAVARQVVERAELAHYRYAHRQELALYERYAAYTMIRSAGFVDSLRLCRHAVNSVDGDLVECGTWRGGMSAAIAQYIDSDRHFSVLFDSFEGLPPANDEMDGSKAVAWQTELPGESNYNNCAASEGEAREAMALAERPFRIEKGWFQETLPRYAAEDPRIAVLRLDCDWFDSTIVCLRTLFPHVLPGGLVIIDDYGTWDGCTRAVHQFLSEAWRPEPIRVSPGGQAYIEKR
jgi:O-methyltransferase